MPGNSLLDLEILPLLQFDCNMQSFAVSKELMVRKGTMEGVQREKARILPSGQMRPREAARFAGVSEKTLANWRVLDQGPYFVKRGGRIFYPFDALKDWVEHDTSKKGADDKGRSSGKAPPGGDLRRT